MKNRTSIIVLASVNAVLMLSTANGYAQDAATPGIQFELGGGAFVAPSYEGSNQYSIGAFPIIRFGYLALDNGFTLGGGDGQGLSFRPSFRYLAARKSADFSAITGLADTKAAIELGAGFKYTAGPMSVFSDVRYGITGHNSFVGELGADLIAKPDEKISLSVGPRASWASSEYMQKYFGVSAANVGTSGFANFNAGAGFKSVGVEANARYQFSENWAFEAGAGYNRLVGDAANSPITAAGSKNQFSGKIGLVRKFQIDF